MSSAGRLIGDQGHRTSAIRAVNIDKESAIDPSKSVLESIGITIARSLFVGLQWSDRCKGL